MAKQQFQPNPRVHQIFDDLEKYLEFCVQYGYVYDESTLYDMRSFAWRQYSKLETGKIPKYCWVESSRPNSVMV